MDPQEHRLKLAKSGVRVIDFAIDRVERVDSRSSKSQAQSVDHVEDVTEPEVGSKRSRLLSKVSLSSVTSRS